MTASSTIRRRDSWDLSIILYNSRNTIERYENSFMGFRNEVIKLNEMVKHHEKTVPSWRREIEACLGKVNLVLRKVEKGWRNLWCGLVISRNLIGMRRYLQIL